MSDTRKLRPSPQQMRLEQKRLEEQGSENKKPICSKAKIKIYKKNEKFYAVDRLGNPINGQSQKLLSALYYAQKAKDELESCKKIINCPNESKKKKQDAWKNLRRLESLAIYTRDAAEIQSSKITNKKRGLFRKPR